VKTKEIARIIMNMLKYKEEDTKLFIKLDDDNVGLKAIEINKSVEIKEKSAKEIGIDSLFVGDASKIYVADMGGYVDGKCSISFIEKVLSEIMEYSLYWSNKNGEFCVAFYDSKGKKRKIWHADYYAIRRDQW